MKHIVKANEPRSLVEHRSPRLLRKSLTFLNS